MAETYKNVLITGGAGNLGRHAYYNLCKDYNCTLFDQVSPEQSRFRGNRTGARGIH